MHSNDKALLVTLIPILIKSTGSKTALEKLAVSTRRNRMFL
uniref:Rho-GAP domain-containing protein n=1 Tax=Anguilla anguilla TaxID=7936 RepID=A0A0E9QLZ5_ANGAN